MYPFLFLFLAYTYLQAFRVLCCGLGTKFPPQYLALERFNEPDVGGWSSLLLRHVCFIDRFKRLSTEMVQHVYHDLPCRV